MEQFVNYAENWIPPAKAKIGRGKKWLMELTLSSFMSWAWNHQLKIIILAKRGSKQGKPTLPVISCAVLLKV